MLSFLKKIFKKRKAEDFDKPKLISTDFTLLYLCDTEHKRKTDFIGISSDKKTLISYSYSRINFEYKITTNLKISEDDVYFIIPCDFTCDSLLDFLIICKKDNKYKMKLWSKNTYLEIPDGVRMPVLFTYSLNYRPALLIQTENGFIILHSFSDTKYEKIDSKITGNLSENHSSAFIDVNGDLKPELVLIMEEENKNRIEIYKFEKGDFNKIESKDIIVNKGGPMVFADFTRKGTNDIVFVTKEENFWFLNILKNCRTPLKTKTYKQGLNWDMIGKEVENWGYKTDDPLFNIKINLEEMFPEMVPVIETEMIENSPSGIFIGDLDMDGLPDILLIMEKQGNRYVKILQNTGESGSKMFKPAEFATEIQKMTGIISVSPCDPENTGRTGIMINHLVDGKPRLSFSQNNFSVENLKLSALTISPDTKKRSYSSGIPGISYLFTNADEKLLWFGCQMPQSSFLHLQSPNVYWGLGNMNLLVDKMYVTGPQSSKYQSYQINNNFIPNSDLVFRPITPSKIEIDLFLNLGMYALFVSIVVICVMVINIILVFIFHFREKRKIKKLEKAEESIFFRAL
ncbi:hypothetical protein CWI39_1742p0020 [Hamiltosporidium magnivora]|uniref:T-cell immunomodulatory protein TIP C2 domain-containing protein n=1 Tax=Hamiltosporidium magnivora TaxID=148818 RepID=A0A4Q9KZ21_9MICR|nr:hypothetical protein CWI39_1742p0020 [Hamiltosporidium magnivora]